MEQRASVSVRFFGSLDTRRRQEGLESAIELPQRAERSALEIAGELALPLERIAGIYCNHVRRGLDHPVRPGDRIAFVPHEVPGIRLAPLGAPWR